MNKIKKYRLLFWSFLMTGFVFGIYAWQPAFHDDQLASYAWWAAVVLWVAAGVWVERIHQLKVIAKKEMTCTS
jgi:hypothetical protein